MESDLEAEIFKYETCDLTCKTKNKFEKHMCRTEVKNPTYRDFYMSKWIVLNRCSAIIH